MSAADEFEIECGGRIRSGFALLELWAYRPITLALSERTSA
jgi:hypothetical protein